MNWGKNMKLTKKIRVSPCVVKRKLPRNPPEMKSWDLILMADPGGQRQKSFPPTNVLKLDTERRKFTESCRCQTCEVKAVCTSTPKKNRRVVWMILLML